tara:strand:+ start:76 stop:270 length:195 start_codon:yes stop_codon:yes gene_type:complete
MNIYKYSEKEQIMNLDKYQQTYLIDLVKHQLKIERKLHADLKNISWETNLKEIIDILTKQLKGE